MIQLKIMWIRNPWVLVYLASLMAYHSILYCKVAWELIQALVVLYVFYAIRALLPHIVPQNLLHIMR